MASIYRRQRVLAEALVWWSGLWRLLVEQFFL